MRLSESDAVMRIDVVGETKPAAPVAGLDAAGLVVSGNNPPTHPLGGVERAIERFHRGYRHGQRHDVGVCRPLLAADLGALISHRITTCSLAQRHHGDKGGRVVRIGRDVVDRRQRPAHLIIMPRHVRDQPAGGNGNDGDRDAAPFDARAPDEQGHHRDDQGGDTEIGCPRHQGLEGEAEMPPARAPTERTERQ